MAGGLFPVVEASKDIHEDLQYDRRYKRSWRWNLKTGDFERNGANQVEGCDGLEAYQIWCMKAVATECKTCLAYPKELGTEMVSAFQKPSQRAQESAIERTIKETLMANPRTESVRDFSFAWDSDTVRVSFMVKGIDYESFRLEL